MALSALRDSLTALSMPYVLQGTAAASDKATLIRDQLGDYVLPRLASLDAPLLAVVGGSTGAGKSTLVSSLVRRHVARASAIRPTTRRPLLLHAPTDAAWFDTDRVLGSLSRMRVDADAPASPATDHTPRELELRACEGLPEGLAIVDAPDVDSVVEDNRDLAATLLAGADLWIFVTTAARYADAVPWEHLRAAAERHITAAIVLDRVPQGAQIEVEADLRRRLAQAHLAGDLLGRLEVGLEGGVLDVVLAGGAAGIHVDRDQGLGRVDDEVAAGAQGDVGREHRVELLLDAVAGEDRRRVAIGLHHLGLAGHQHPHEVLGLAIGVFARDQNLVEILVVEVADRPLDQRALLVDQRPHRFRAPRQGVQRAAPCARLLSYQVAPALAEAVGALGSTTEVPFSRIASS